MLFISRRGRCGSASGNWQRIWRPFRTGHWNSRHQPGQPEQSGKRKAKKKRKDGKPRGNEPPMNLKGERKRSCGADLTSIDGIGTISALTIVSEIGTDMRKFADENHFACRLGLGGNENTSGGRRVRGPKRKVKNRVADVLRMGAGSLLNSDSYPGARYRHLRRTTKTHAIAIKATARYLAVLIYRLLTKGQAWVDSGAAQFEQKRAQQNIAMLRAQALAQGYQVVPITQPS